MSGDILEFKPNFGPTTLNPIALLKWASARFDSGSPMNICRRFLTVFREHGVAPSQIQRIIPEITLDKLNGYESLAAALNNRVLERTSKLLGVRREWIEGIDEKIYAHRWCYKQPELFWRDFAQIAPESQRGAVQVLYCDEALGEIGGYKPLVLVLRERVKNDGGIDLRRYFIYETVWRWDHPPCRIQLKATARLLFKIIRTPVPLRKVSRALIDKIGEGKCVPHRYLLGSSLTEPSLEDYALAQDESLRAKATHELPIVLSYIAENGLEELALRCCPRQED